MLNLNRLSFDLKLMFLTSILLVSLNASYGQNYGTIDSVTFTPESIQDCDAIRIIVHHHYLNAVMETLPPAFTPSGPNSFTINLFRCHVFPLLPFIHYQKDTFYLPSQPVGSYSIDASVFATYQGSDNVCPMAYVNGDNSTTPFLVSNCTATTESIEQVSIQISPNPTSGHIVIDMASENFLNASIYSVSGQKLAEFKDREFSFLSLDPGYYILSIQTTSSIINERIMKL
jgi:hypothetical protein